jgi:hypothetical protein
VTVDEIMAEAQRETPARKHLAHLVELATQALDLAVEEGGAWDSPSHETFAKHARERLAQGVMARELDVERERADERTLLLAAHLGPSWLVSAERRGGHVHARIFHGTPGQRAQLGSLVFNEAEWEAFDRAARALGAEVRS